MATKLKLTPEMRQALWNIQKDGGLILTFGADIDHPYTTKKGRPIHARTAMALIKGGQLRAEGELLPGETPGAWQVSSPVDQTPV